MKYLFLDFDGVLNVPRRSDFDKEFVGNLNRITDSTGAKIVLSTSWRDIFKFKDLVAILQTHGVTGEIIDVIKTLSVLDGCIEVASKRGAEILAWCVYHNVGRLGVYKGIVAIDDYCDELMEPFTAKCDCERGLTSDVADEAIEILNRK